MVINQKKNGKEGEEEEEVNNNNKQTTKKVTENVPDSKNSMCKSPKMGKKMVRAQRVWGRT